MKMKALVCGVVFIVVVFVGVCSFAAEKEKFGFYVPSPREVFFGTWVNKEYSGGSFMPQKFVDYRWGSYEVYMLAIHKTPDFVGSSIIVDKWSDAEGNIWYKVYSRENWTTEAFFALEKFSEDGKVKEFVWSYYDFPSEDDLNSKNDDSHYHIYYRQ